MNTQHLKNILSPVDFSQDSIDGFDYAISLAHKLGAKITLLHVMPSLDLIPILEDSKDYGPVKAALEEEKTERQKRLKKISKRSSLVKKIVIEEGGPYEQIVKYAQKEKFDLIVLGATGVSNIGKSPLGSTALKVARKALCPVLVVKGKKEAHIKKILVPTDFSRYASYALNFACSLEHIFKAEIHLLHVINYWAYTGRLPVLLDAVKEHMEAEAKRFGPKVKPFFVIKTDINKTIRDYCEDNEIDLIIMGTRGRSGLKRLLLGSISEKQLWCSPVPIVIARPKGAKPIWSGD